MREICVKKYCTYPTFWLSFLWSTVQSDLSAFGLKWLEIIRKRFSVQGFSMEFSFSAHTSRFFKQVIQVAWCLFLSMVVSHRKINCEHGWRCTLSPFSGHISTSCVLSCCLEQLFLKVLCLGLAGKDPTASFIQGIYFWSRTLIFIH